MGWQGGRGFAGSLRKLCCILALPSLLVLLPACGGSGSQRLMSGTFVGRLPTIDSYIAVVVAEPDKGANTRAVRVYLCNGKDINEWFSGRGGGEVSLDSESGKSHVDVQLAPVAAAGTVKLAEGRSIAFRATRSKGIAGLYESTLFPDGRVRGSSETGVRLVGRRVSPTPDESGRFRGAGYYILPGGKRVPWVTFSRAVLPKTGAIESRVIVLADGSRKGKFKRPALVFGGNDQPQ